MYKNLIGICVAMFLMAGCTDVQRASTVDTITYSDTEVTILFKDGLVITTPNFDAGIQPGDVVDIKHLKNGEIVITK